MAKDFRNKQFGRIIRGYNPDEVDEYIAYINDEYRKLERRCADSDRKLALALKKLDEMHQKFMGADNADNELAAAAISEAKDEADRIIADANTHAAQIAEDAEKDATEKARAILEEAAKSAEEIISGAENDASANKKTAESMYAAAEKMYGEVCAFRDSLFAIYNTHIESIEQMTEEAERVMGVIEDAFEPEEEAEVESAEEPFESEEDDEVPFTAESAEDATEEDEKPDEDVTVEDLFIDLEEEADEAFAEPADDEVYDDPDDGEEYDDSEDEDARGCKEPDTDAYDSLDTADYDSIDGEYDDLDDDDAFTIDWSSRMTVQEDDADDGETDEDPDVEEIPVEEPAADEVFKDLDDMFTAGEAEEMSLTDEFDLVFNASNAKKNVEQIRKQPTVAPEKPKNPKKHQKF